MTPSDSLSAAQSEEMTRYGISEAYRPYAGRLAAVLKPGRFTHSLAVASLSRRLAERWQLDAEKAELAGLLHDVAKYLSETQMYDYCRRYGIETEGSVFSLLHAPVGAALLREEWGIEDEEVLEAVAAHTVARIGMSDLQRIVYLADVAEENRHYEGVEEVRRLIFEDLDAAMLFNLSQSIADLERQGKFVAPASREALKYYQAVCRHHERGNDMDSEKILSLAVEAVKAKKGEDIVSMDLRGLTVIADYFLIASAQSSVQVQAIADSIVEKAEEAGLGIDHLEGYNEGKWILLDLGSVIVHVFQPETRNYYNLERLWAAAPITQY